MLTTKSVNNLAAMANDRGHPTRQENSGEPGPKNPNKPRTISNELTFDTGKDLITYIFPDFKAVEYFRKDFISLNEFHILEKTYATGFEIYLVDQWIRDRKIGSVASVFTGNSHSKVKVCKFTTTKKKSRDYPPRFQEYLNELLLNHATFKKMDNMTTDPAYSPPVEDGSEVPAYLLVSNISAMPHNLFLVPIPDGDARAVEHRYMVNSNLKKLNCGGRSLSLLTEKVSDASEDKFRQMYCILNESVPIQFAILELVNIIQTCLFYFDLFDAKYADGLLCHKTEDAIKNWWNLIGLPHFNSKPNPKSGVLSSKTVAAIISLTVGVKLRLQLIGGCDVPKDIFDAESFMISIGHFQKQVKIEKRRKLNLLTLSRLFHFTNQSHLSEKQKSFYSPFGNELTLDDSDSYAFYDQSLTSPMSSGKNGSYSNTSLPGQTASAYRRNKIFYSKELKKLTNVVKNTVQDHIMVKEDQDDLYSDPSPTKPTKLRSKIVSKLSENLVPADIETTDIEIFSKKCIVGKTLQRLWVGLSSAEAKLAAEQLDVEKNPLSSSSNNQSDTGKSLRNQNNNGHHSHHHRRHHRDEEAWAGPSSHDSNGYSFMSFRDSFATNQDLSLVADKSGRLGRMKLPFQSRKAPVKSEVGEVQPNGFERISSKDEANGTLLDTELQKLSESPPSLLSNRGSEPKSPIAEPKAKIGRKMNRRSSYPFVRYPIDANLSTIDAIHDEATKFNNQKNSLKRAASFSILEGYFRGCSEMSSYEKMRIDYLALILKSKSLDSMRRKCEDKFANKVTTKAKQANLDIQKIQATHTMILHRKLRFESEYAALLDIKMKDLADNLDKMAFRSRDLIKKIDELDEHLSIFKSKLQSESMAKLDSMIDRVLHSAKFDYVFEDREEKLRIIKSLKGPEGLAEENNTAGGGGLCIRLIAVYLYEILLCVLRIFHFDRSKMNLDRIRRQYKKLDPNREYISKVYELVGHELNCDPSGRSTSEEKEKCK